MILALNTNDLLERKLDRLISLLEEREILDYRQSFLANRFIPRDLILNTILAGALGYFIIRVLDHHFR